MTSSKGAKATNRIVWRMSSTSPAGKYVDAADPVREPATPVEVPENGWLASSLDLLSGVRVSEAPMDTLPGELVCEFFKARR